MRRPYTVRSQAFWDQARDAYLAGESAPSVCQRFNLGLSAFRKRAKAEGWRLVDRPDVAPQRQHTAQLMLAAATLKKQTIAASQRHNQALREGRLEQAQSWFSERHRLIAEYRQVMTQARGPARPGRAAGTS